MLEVLKTLKLMAAAAAAVSADDSLVRLAWTDYVESFFVPCGTYLVAVGGGAAGAV